VQITPLRMEKKFLEPPVLEKNWLISPPGSPQENWVQIREDPPNSVTLHNDIQSALNRLAVQLGQDLDGAGRKEDSKEGNVILDTTDLGGVQVIVQNWDAREEAEGESEEQDQEVREFDIRNMRTSVAIGKTPRPPAHDE
jgi:calcipressin-2